MESRHVQPEEFKKGIWLVVDPGHRTAWETWENGKPISSGMLNWAGAKSGDDSQRKIIDLAESFKSRIAGCTFKGICIENIRVMSFPSVASGSLFFPAMLIGAFIFICYMFRQEFFMIDPNWRGQISDEQLRNLLAFKFNYHPTNEHLADVRGMGLWLAGKF